MNYFYETLTNISISLEKIDVFLDDDATQLDECSAAILLLLNYGFINILSEEEAEVGDTFVYENHDNVEASLADNWTYYSLIGIGVVGAFAFLSIARKVLTPNSDDDRPRDFRTKQAGENKIANVIQNALNMRVDAAQTKGQVMVRSPVSIFATRKHLWHLKNNFFLGRRVYRGTIFFVESDM